MRIEKRLLILSCRYKRTFFLSLSPLCLDWERKSLKRTSLKMTNKEALKTHRRQTKVPCWTCQKINAIVQTHLNTTKMSVRQKPDMLKTVWTLMTLQTWKFRRVHCTHSRRHRHLIWIPNWIFISEIFQGHHLPSPFLRPRSCWETSKNFSKWLLKTRFSMNSK